MFVTKRRNMQINPRPKMGQNEVHPLNRGRWAATSLLAREACKGVVSAVLKSSHKAMIRNNYYVRRFLLFAIYCYCSVIYYCLLHWHCYSDLLAFYIVHYVLLHYYSPCIITLQSGSFRVLSSRIRFSIIVFIMLFYIIKWLVTVL